MDSFNYTKVYPIYWKYQGGTNSTVGPEGSYRT